MISPKDMKRIMTSPYRLLGPVERFLLEDNSTKSAKRDKMHLHPSEICKKDWCPRSSYYRISGYPEPDEKIGFQKLLVFAEGHNIHEKWQTWLLDAGVLKQAEVPIYNEEHMIMGHADGVIEDKKGTAVLEIKSVGVGTIRFEDYDLFGPYSRKEITIDELWKSVRHPFDSHIRQIQLYMYCLDIHEGVFLYEWKPTQEVKEFSIQFQPEIVAPILASCSSVKRSLENKTPPDRPIWLTPESRVCKYCPFKEECWNANSSGAQSTNGRTDGGTLSNDRVPQQVFSPRETDGLDSRDAREPRRVIR